MSDIFSKICKQCGGECCYFDVFLSKNDLRKLGPFKFHFRTRKNNSGFTTFYKNAGTCPFLKKNRGCILPENRKPLDCSLFPLTFFYKNKRIKFYANKDCAFLHKIPKTWIIRTKKLARRELKHWSEKEKRSLSKYVEEHKELVPV